MISEKGVKIIPMTVIGILAAIILLVLVIGLQGWYQKEVQLEIASKWDQTPTRELAELNQRQIQNISTYRWIDRSSQIAAIPIDQAEKLLIANAGKLPSTQPAK
jgi:capsular polysaccharide biosynthesis protein